MAGLVCYRIRESLAGQPIRDFPQIVDTDNGNLDAYGPEDYGDFSAMLFVRNTHPHPLSWQPFVREGFGEDVVLPLVPGSAAVVIVAIPIHEHARFFAIPFGTGGRYLLRDGVYERSFGLKVALNLVFSGAASDENATRIQAVDTARLGTTSVRARKQASRVSTLETFDVDRLREVLRQLVVKPSDTDRWGARLVGGDSAKVATDVDFADLGTMCRSLSTVADQDAYRKRVPWVDHVRLIQDPDERAAVESAIVDVLRTGDPEGRFALSPPEILDWLGLAGFRFTGDPRPRGRNGPVLRSDVELAHYLTTDVRTSLDLGQLRRHQIFAVDGDGSEAGHWSIWRSLTGSVEVDGRAYVLDDADIFEADLDYMRQIDRLVDEIPEAEVLLPDCPAKISEENDYNRWAAERVGGLLMLDRKLVAPGFSTAIELCDLLSQDRRLIHIKRHFSADGLSHLFNQGQVSAEALLQFAEFASNAAKQCLSQGSPGHANLFETGPFDATAWEVVYGIVGRWHGKSASERIPFFSKLTLVHAATRLRQYGFGVSLRKIERLTA